MPTEMQSLSSPPLLPTDWNATLPPIRRKDNATALSSPQDRNETISLEAKGQKKSSRSVNRHNRSWISHSRIKDALPSETMCTPPLLAVHDTLVATKDHPPPAGAIPRVVHVASRSRCMTAAYADNLQLWRFANHSLRVHDDAAVNQLLWGSDSHDWARYFPRLNQALHCLPRNGASSPSKADLWRYLQLWHTGGVYTDIDNAPGASLANRLDALLAATTTTSAPVDALMALNRHGKLGQSFLVVTPRHPLMRLCALIAIDRLLAIPQLSTQHTWKVTGPDVLDTAFGEFAGQALTRTATGGLANGTYELDSQLAASWRQAFPGEAWIHVRSLTVVGSPAHSDAYVKTSVIRGAEKLRFYKLTGMFHWKSRTEAQHESTLSCQAWLAHLNVTTQSGR
jgi:hypothetical protein